MMLQAFHLRTRCPRSALQGRLYGSMCQRLCTSFHSVRKPSQYTEYPCNVHIYDRCASRARANAPYFIAELASK